MHMGALEDMVEDMVVMATGHMDPMVAMDTIPMVKMTHNSLDRLR